MPFIITNGSSYCHKTRTQAVEIVNDSASATRFSSKASAEKLLLRATKKLKGFEIRELPAQSSAPLTSGKPQKSEAKAEAAMETSEKAPQETPSKRRRGRPKKNDASSATKAPEDAFAPAQEPAQESKQEPAPETAPESRQETKQENSGKRSSDRRRRGRSRSSHAPAQAEESAALFEMPAPVPMDNAVRSAEAVEAAETDEAVPEMTHAADAKSAPEAKEAKVEKPAPEMKETKDEAPAPAKEEVKVETPATEKEEAKVEAPAPEKEEAKVEASAPEKKEAKVETPVPEKKEAKVEAPAPKEKGAASPVSRPRSFIPVVRDIQAASASLWGDEPIVSPSLRKKNGSKTNASPEKPQAFSNPDKDRRPSMAAAESTPAMQASSQAAPAAQASSQAAPAVQASSQAAPAVQASSQAAPAVQASSQATPAAQASSQAAPAMDAMERDSVRETSERRSNRKRHNRREASARNSNASPFEAAPANAEDIFTSDPAPQMKPAAATSSREESETRQGTGRIRSTGKRIGKVSGNLRSSRSENESSQSKRRFFTTKERNMIYNRSEGHCGICGRFIPLEEYTIDHIIPLSKGGTNDLDNLQACCSFCNKAKDDSMGEEFFERIQRIFLYQAKLRYGKKQFKQLKKTLKELE